MAKKGIDKKKYDRLAKIYDFMETPMELLSFARWRSKAIDKVFTAHNILEVGTGTGKNLPCYNEGQQVFAFDISKKMLKKAKVRAKKSKAIVDLAQMDAESLGFADSIFYASVATYVLCSVENPLSGLFEIRRVLKKDGIAVFLEPMRSENGLVGKSMDLMNPIVSRMGPNMNRRTVRNIENAGFEVIEEVRLFTSIFRLIVARPKPE